MAVEHRTRKADGLGVSLRGEPGDGRAAGISQPKRLGDLVERLADGVVDGGAEHLVAAPLTHVDEHGVAARDEARHKRRREVRRLEEVGKEVALEVMAGDERKSGGNAEALGKGHAHHEGADEAGTRSDADGGEVGWGKRVAAKVGASAREHLLEDAHDGLGVLARGNLGHHAAKARVEVDLGGHDARAHGSVGVDDGHGGLVAAALDGKDEGACRLERGHGRSAALAGDDRPGADGGCGLGRGVVLLGRERKGGSHDQRVVALAVVAAAKPDLLEPEALVQRDGSLVARVDLERDGLRVEHLPVVGESAEQPGSDALPTPVGRHGDVDDLEALAAEHAPRKADDATAVVGHPPAAAGLRELVVEHVLREDVVHSALVCLALELGDLGQVVHAHRPELQVDARKLLGHPRALHEAGLAETKAGALVLLGVGEARVDRQHQRGVARLGDVVVGRSGGGAKQALPRGIPDSLVEKRRRHKARRLELGAVPLESVTREPQPVAVGALGPLGGARLGLAHALADEGAGGAGLVQLVDAGIDLAAHGVACHGDKTAHA